MSCYCSDLICPTCYKIEKPPNNIGSTSHPFVNFVMNEMRPVKIKLVYFKYYMVFDEVRNRLPVPRNQYVYLFFYVQDFFFYLIVLFFFVKNEIKRVDNTKEVDIHFDDGSDGIKRKVEEAFPQLYQYGYRYSFFKCKETINYRHTTYGISQSKSYELERTDVPSTVDEAIR
jgi:hypothetical protein